MKIVWLLVGVFVVLGSHGANAETHKSGDPAALTQNFKWVDSGVLTEGAAKGIYLQFIADEALQRESAVKVMQELCRKVAGAAVPHVLKNTDLKDPAFIKVHVETETRILFFKTGQYAYAKFAFVDGTCGGEID